MSGYEEKLRGESMRLMTTCVICEARTVSQEAWDGMCRQCFDNMLTETSWQLVDPIGLEVE